MSITKRVAGFGVGLGMGRVQKNKCECSGRHLAVMLSVSHYKAEVDM